MSHVQIKQCDNAEFSIPLLEALDYKSKPKQLNLILTFLTFYNFNFTSLKIKKDSIVQGILKCFSKTIRLLILEYSNSLLPVVYKQSDLTRAGM